MITRNCIFKFIICLSLSLVALSPAHAQTNAPTPSAAPKKVVASFAILGDLIKNIAGNRVQITTLVGANSDTHVYSPTPLDAKNLSEADMLVINGLGFEAWIERLVTASKTKAVRVVASRDITPLTLEKDDGHGHGQEHGHHHGHNHGAKNAQAKDPHAKDPHAWQNVSLVKQYVLTIRDALIALDPDGKTLFETNTQNYIAQLDALDAQIKSVVASIPQERRRILTSHDAFGYFGKAYGLEMIGVQGVSTESEVSAGDVAKIIRQIKKNKTPAIFVENISDARLMQRISSETGAKIGGKLYSDSLSDQTGSAPTYIQMMQHNIKTLSDALKPS